MKLPLFADGIIIYAANLKEVTKKPWNVSDYGKIAGHRLIYKSFPMYQP